MEHVIRKRVFLANADKYDELYIGKRLTETTIGSATITDDMEQMEEDEMEKNEKSGDRYEIFTSLINEKCEKPEFVKEVFKFEKRNELYENIVSCDYVIYNIKDDDTTIDEAMWILDKLHQNITELPSQKIFILISTALTWAKSTLLDENDPELPFTDEDYARRKAHCNYVKHLNAEKTTIYLGKTDKTKLLTYVICTGITYGERQNVFHWFFKEGWNNAPSLSYPGDGQNVVPTIHVNDLASIIQTVMELRPTKHYILAKDDSQNTLKEIVKAISKGLTTGKIKSISRDEAFLSEELKQSQIDQLLINLRMDASFIKEHGSFRWHCENGMVEDIMKLLREFKLARQLIPIRLCILGPPASGKTTLAKRLCQHYKLHHIHIKGVIDEAIALLKRRIEADAEGEDQTVRNTKSLVIDEEDETGTASAVELLENIQQNLEENNGRLDLDFVSDFFRQKLNSKPCQNQGFIIDGYPKSKKQAIALFSAGGGGEEEEEEDNEMDEGGGGSAAVMSKINANAVPSTAENFVQRILTSGFDVADMCNEPGLLPTQPIPNQLPRGLQPDYVFELQATDKFLRDRIMSMPEQKVHGTHYTEAGQLRRLAEYRANQIGESPINPTGAAKLPDPHTLEMDKENVLNPMSPLASASIHENSVRAYFDSKGILQIPIDIMSDESEDLEATFQKVVHFLGTPRNYGLTREERDELLRKEAAEQLERKNAEEERLYAEKEAEMQARKERQMQWLSKHEALVKEENEYLNKEAEPLRAYLRQHVMPVLANGLTECVRRRPEDPIDFLAEYLFFHNPQMD